MEAQTMTQYAVMIFERETPGGVGRHPAGGARGARAPAGAHQGLRRPDRRRPRAGATATATSIRSDLVTDGPFVESKEAIAGIFVIEARDLDHAIELARMTPIMDGGVEVRPLLGFEVVAD